MSSTTNQTIFGRSAAPPVPIGTNQIIVSKTLLTIVVMLCFMVAIICFGDGGYGCFAHRVTGSSVISSFTGSTTFRDFSSRTVHCIMLLYFSGYLLITLLSRAGLLISRLDLNRIRHRFIVQFSQSVGCSFLFSFFLIGSPCSAKLLLANNGCYQESFAVVRT